MEEDRSKIKSLLDNLDISDYSYTLPPERIARFPLAQRDGSKLLVYQEGEIRPDRFTNLEGYICSGNTLVFNNSKVIQARLEFFKVTGSRIEIFCLEPIAPSDIQMAFQQKKSVIWKCLVGNQKKWKQGPLTKKVGFQKSETILTATLKETSPGGNNIEFSWSNRDLTFGEVLENAGKTPIPPYLNREPQPLDKERYQTIYSVKEGSVAAPTAGLHFSGELIERLKDKNVDLVELTLHVGIGTFRPIMTDSLINHEMHAEHFSVTIESIRKLRRITSGLVAAGTTSVRTLESIYLLGVKIQKNRKIKDNQLTVNQWDGILNECNIQPVEALYCLEEYMDRNELSILQTTTRLMIVPGYRFKMTEALLTNFHMPRSSLIMLVAAFIGDDWKRVYQYALDNDFRFLSYGDSSILFPKKPQS